MNAKETADQRQMVAELQDRFDLEIVFTDGEWQATGGQATACIDYLRNNDFWQLKWFETGGNFRINDGLNYAVYLGRKLR